ncbi:uncharacterized protein LOC110428944, partial [Herrania umbratica]|uniref:Uncharacterized protein LOC110428944 n=1 Tax=Herrania umbratica TaxID=108875 RepID=A0A6J1BQJ4_9ROSI
LFVRVVLRLRGGGRVGVAVGDRGGATLRDEDRHGDADEGHDRDDDPDHRVGVGADREDDDGRGDQHRDQVHDLDQRVDRRAGGVLERVTDGVADDRRLVGVGALAAVVAVLDQLLRVVPGATGVGQEHRHQRARGDRAREVARERTDAEAEADGDRGEDGEQAGGGQLAQRVAGAEVDHAAVLRALRAVHDPRPGGELAPDLVDDRTRRPGHRVDRETREHEHDRGTDDDADEQVRGRDVVEVGELLPRLRVGLGDRVVVRPEQRGRREDGRRDRDALGDGLRGVPDRVELGQDLGGRAVDVARHLGDALGVVGDRPEGVHRDDDADRGQQAGAREGDGEQGHEHRARQQERAVHGGPDDDRGVDRRLEADRDAGEDDRGGTGERAGADVLDRLGLGAGVVAGQREDDDRQHDADDHRGERDDL